MTSENATPQFNVSASLIRRLGEEIVSDTVSALTELIKNAYDADAEQVKIEINTRQVLMMDQLHYKSDSAGFIKVEDDGTGMTWEDVQQYWMNFSFSSKREFKSENTTKKKRSPTGGQGMGRLGTLRLGDYVELFTSANQELYQSHVALDWDQFSTDKPLTEVPSFAEQLSTTKQKGTTLIIFPLKDVNQWIGANGQNLITQLTNRVFSFVDRNTFRITVQLDNLTIDLGKSGATKASVAKVYLENVWQKMSPALTSEVIKFWDDNKMLRPGFSSEERASQVVLIIRSEAVKKIVGLTTAGVVTFKQLNSNNFYLYRSIILPGYRQPGLASKIIVETRDFLESFNKNTGSISCIGMLTFVENPRIQQFRREAIWKASKMAYIGMDKMGRHIRVYYFKGATI